MNHESTEPTTEPTSQRRGVRWYHVVVLGITVLVCAAAVGFFVNQTSERDDATSKREDAQAQLAAQRSDTGLARTNLTTERSDTKTALDDVAAITTSLHEFSDLVAQHVDAVAAAHAVALRLPASVDEFNAAVTHANDTLEQVRAKAQAIQQQVDSIRGKVDAQLAVARR